ncbi:uncharacterized protein ARMOST_16673 [Armillaria ostoyae]|uniref:Uncharacterized protein n=1 Tax=Armillaria ostoyae TaxID=47428 RepID=A0A284RWV4_ARMOS|nr:uncharacterized protein ARMOST_16673 [Armillaria ostoyae]
MHLGRRAAILQTPNFIMKTTDALQGTAPDDALWTLHVFDDLTAEDSEHNVVPAGQAIRVPEDRNTLPPHCIFAAVYASVLLTSWPAQDFLTQVRSYWSNSFYPEAQQSHDEAKCKARIDSDSRVR